MTFKYNKPELIPLNSENDKVVSGVCQNGSTGSGNCQDGGTAAGKRCRSGGTPGYRCRVGNIAVLCRTGMVDDE